MHKLNNGDYISCRNVSQAFLIVTANYLVIIFHK